MSPDSVSIQVPPGVIIRYAVLITAVRRKRWHPRQVVWAELNRLQRADYLISKRDIDHICRYVSGLGNPSYTFHMTNGDVYYMVDDFGALNGLDGKSLIRIDTVRTRSELF